MTTKYSKLNTVEEGLQHHPAPYEDPVVLATVVSASPPAGTSSTRSSILDGPSIVKAVLTKETKTTSLGIGWHFTPQGARGGGVKIWKIQEDGIAATAAPELRVGMKLLRINETDFQRSKSPNDVVLAISAIEGDVTIVAAADPSSFYSTVCVDEGEKKQHDAPPITRASHLGIDFANISRHEIVVKLLHSSSPFAQQWKGERILIGDTVLMIDDLDCTQGTVSEDDLYAKLDQVLSSGSDVTIYFKRSVGASSAPPQRARGKLSIELGSDSPPPGIRAGGVWGSNVYCGSQTSIASFVCCLLCGGISAIVICCFPFDKRRVYRIDQSVYDSTGALIGTAGGVPVQEGETVGFIDSERMSMGFTFAGMIGFVLVFVFYILPMGLHALAVH